MSATGLDLFKTLQTPHIRQAETPAEIEANRLACDDPTIRTVDV